MPPLVPLILSIALFMESLDATIIALALPAIAADLGTDLVTLKLALTAYYVALATFVPLGSWAADRFGILRVLQVATLIFVLGSLGCALSPNLPVFVAARFVEGVGGALMAPVARIALFRVTERKDLVSATSWFTIPTVVAPMIGPPLGGFLTSFAGWPFVFLVNLPIAALGLVLLTRHLPDVPREAPRPVAVSDVLTLGLALGGTSFGVSMLGTPSLPGWWSVAMIAVGLASGLVHLRVARRRSHPLLDFSLLRLPAFRSVMLGSALLFLACGALPFLTALVLQIGFGLSALDAGLVTLSSALGAIFAKLVARRVFSSLGLQAAVAGTAVLAAVGIALKGVLVPSVPILLVALLLFVNGLMRSFAFTGLAVMTVCDVPETRVGDATVVSIVVRQTASAFSIALVGGVTGWVAAGHPPGLGDFQAGILLSATICLLAAIVLLSAPAVTRSL